MLQLKKHTITLNSHVFKVGIFVGCTKICALDDLVLENSLRPWYPGRSTGGSHESWVMHAVFLRDLEKLGFQICSIFWIVSWRVCRKFAGKKRVLVFQILMWGSLGSWFQIFTGNSDSSTDLSLSTEIPLTTLGTTFAYTPRKCAKKGKSSTQKVCFQSDKGKFFRRVVFHFGKTFQTQSKTTKNARFGPSHPLDTTRKMSPEIDGKSHLKTSWNPPSSRTQRWDSTGIFLYVWKWFLINPTKRFSLCAILLVSLSLYIYIYISIWKHLPLQPVHCLLIPNKKPLVSPWPSPPHPVRKLRRSSSIVVELPQKKKPTNPNHGRKHQDLCVLFPLCLFFCWWIGVHCLCLMVLEGMV